MGKLKNTNNKAFRQLVFYYLCSSIYDYDEAMANNVLLSDNEESRARYLRDRFEREYNYEANKQYFKSGQERVASWLSGLPLNIAYTYVDIIATAEMWHETTLNEKQRELICDNWFNFLAFNLHKLWELYGIDDIG